MKKFMLSPLKEDKIQITINGKNYVLSRIVAIRDFHLADGTLIPAGKKGGYVEKEENLSQKGGSWVFEGCKVFGDAFVGDNAIMFGNTMAYGKALLLGHSQMYGNAKIFGKTIVKDYSRVYANSVLGGKVRVGGTASVSNTEASHGKFVNAFYNYGLKNYYPEDDGTEIEF